MVPLVGTGSVWPTYQLRSLWAQFRIFPRPRVRLRPRDAWKVGFENTHNRAHKLGVSSNWICQANFPSSWGRDFATRFSFLVAQIAVVALVSLKKKSHRNWYRVSKRRVELNKLGGLWAREEECLMLISLSISS
jgi:hypothetical protein